MITLKNTPDQVALAKAIGSKNQAISKPAQEAYAAAIGPVIAEVLMQLGTTPLIYDDFAFGENDNQVIPLDLFYNQVDEYVKVWYAPSIIGHLPTSELSSFGELRFTTYELEGALSLPKKYARAQSALKVLSRATERLVNEILVRQELQGWAVATRALAEASNPIDNTGTNVDHLLQAGTAGVFKLDDLSRLMTLSRRLNRSYAGGSPVNLYSNGITDLFVSPEVKEDIRAFVYNPMNTTAVPNTDESTAVALPDNIREEIYRNAGSSSLFDINITDINEFGVNQTYNTLFSTYAPASIAPGGGNFSASTNEFCFGLDLTKKELIRPVATDDADISSSVTVSVDDQWVSRMDKVGWFANVKEGRVCVQSRSFCGIII